MQRKPSGARSRTRGRSRRSPAERALHSLLRVGLWAAAILFFGLFVSKIWHPYGLNRSLHQDLQQTQRELDAVREDNARQRRRIQYLNTPQGEAAEARRLGYHFRGEIPLRIQEPSPATPAPKTPSTP